MVVVGDGTVETAYYSDQPIRVVLVEHDLVDDMPDEAISEPIVFDLADANLPSSVSEQVKALLYQASEAAM